MNRPEEILARLSLAAVQAPDVALYPNPVGTGYHRVVGPLIRKALAGFPDQLRAVEAILTHHAVSFGLGGRYAKGSPDYFGAVAGTALGIEFKATHPDSCVCPSCSDQRAWHNAFARRGGMVARVRTVDEAIAAVERARRGR